MTPRTTPPGIGLWIFGYIVPSDPALRARFYIERSLMAEALSDPPSDLTRVVIATARTWAGCVYQSAGGEA